jgi:hypothetical protein
MFAKASLNFLKKIRNLIKQNKNVFDLEKNTEIRKTLKAKTNKLYEKKIESIEKARSTYALFANKTWIQYNTEVLT